MHLISHLRRLNVAGLLTCVLIVLLAATATWSSSGGPPNGVAGDPPQYNNCTQCHNQYPVNTGDGLLQLLGLPAAYQPDSTYLLTITLQDAGQSRWGFELTSILSNGAMAGALAPVDSDSVQLSIDTVLVREYLKHTTAGTQEGLPSGGWTIAWTAPPATSDTVHFYLAGNAANGNGTNQGDYIYTISAHIPEFVLGVEDSPALPPATPMMVSAYPNPFNPSTVIRFQLPAASFVKLEVFDVDGRNVGAGLGAPAFGLSEHGGSPLEGWCQAGVHEVAFDGTGLPSGIYIYRLEAGQSRAAGKIILLK